MVSNNWVITLPPGAHTLHNRIDKSEAPSLSSSRSTQAGQPQTKGTKQRVSVDAGMLRSRPILRDVVNGLQ